MLGSGVSLAPLSYKKVEHRDEILYYKSTTQSQERMIPMLNQDIPQKFSIWKMLLSQMLKIFLMYFIFVWNYPGKNTVAPPVEP